MGNRITSNYIPGSGNDGRTDVRLEGSRSRRALKCEPIVALYGQVEHLQGALFDLQVTESEFARSRRRHITAINHALYGINGWAYMNGSGQALPVEAVEAIERDIAALAEYAERPDFHGCLLQPFRAIDRCRLATRDVERAFVGFWAGERGRGELSSRPDLEAEFELHGRFFNQLATWFYRGANFERQWWIAERGIDPGRVDFVWSGKIPPADSWLAL